MTELAGVPVTGPSGAVVAAGVDPVDVLVPAFAVGLALVHLYTGRVRSFEAIPRSRWLSLAGGISVAYVFVHILPDVGTAAETVDESGTVLAAVDRHVYLVTLAGFVVFYGLERFARGRSASDSDRTPESDSSPNGVFWLHTASFAAYNALVGYLLLHREEPSATSLTLFFVAMALHFVVNDVGLREHHGQVYHRYGRWLLAGAVIVGLAVGYATTVSEFAVALLFAFLAGGVILNVVKEELPAERRSRFWAFAAGAAGYSLLLLLV